MMTDECAGQSDETAWFESNLASATALHEHSSWALVVWWCGVARSTEKLQCRPVQGIQIMQHCSVSNDPTFLVA